MTRYASETTVTVEASRVEIEKTLKRYRADQFGYLTDDAGAVIAFRLDGRHVRFNLPMPDKEAREFTHTPATGSRRSATVQETAWEQACRQRWRALALVIKAKLEAVAAGITTVEDEFLSATVLPDGKTVGEWAKPQLAKAYQLGSMPAQLSLAAPS